MLRALVFDVDGTLADTETVHLAAFNHAFKVAGLDWSWSMQRYTRLLEISGGRERLRYYWQHDAPETFADSAAAEAQIVRLHAIKTEFYTRCAGDGMIALRPGVLDLIRAAQSDGLMLAIATTTTPDNIDALLTHALGAKWRSEFSAVGDAVTAPQKKPDPQVYLQILRLLELKPNECLALEDSGNGLKAANAAGIATVVTPTCYTAAHDFAGAMHVLPDLTYTSLLQLRQRHATFNQI